METHPNIALRNPIQDRINEAADNLRRHTDCWPWYWLSYGEKCYAFAVVSAIRAEKGDRWAQPGTELTETENGFVGENGEEMIVMDWVLTCEMQAGDDICRFVALSHYQALKKGIDMTITSVDQAPQP